jgi:NAD(P)-dependent dehydrogenase (short-subunit alcohol dehydrogenase family)
VAGVRLLRQVTMSSAAPTISQAVVITGASTGIGRACALELDRRGFRVFACVRNDAAAEQLRADASSRLTPVSIDVTIADTIAAAAKTVANATGGAGLAGLVNNAGVVVSGPLELVPIDELRRQLEVNVIGQVAVTQAFLPLLRKAKGRIVNISSINGGLAVPYMSPYSASKFALEVINDALRLELRNFGIRVSAVEPGAIATPIWEKAVTTANHLADNVDPAALALYDADMAAMRTLVDRMIQTASPADRVVKAVVHALTARRPKAHYYLGWQVRSCFTSLRVLPDGLRDWLVRKAIGLR